MKKVLITISGLKLNFDEGAKNRLNSFISSYKKEGYEVTVLFFFNLKGIKHWFCRKKELHSDITWIYLPSLPISKVKFFARFSVLYGQLVLALITKLKQFDIVQSEIIGDIGRWLPKDVLFITDFHGDAVSEFSFKHNTCDHWFLDFVKERQRRSVELSQHVVVVSEELKKQLEYNSDFKINNYSVISCGADIERFQIGSEQKASFAEAEDRIAIGYIGGLQKWQSVESILKLFLALQSLDKKYYLVLYTNDTMKAYSNFLDEVGENNYLVKSLRFEEVPRYLKLLDAGFLLRDNLTLNKVSSPTKLSEYLAAGVPVICTKYSGDYKEKIAHCKEGFVIDSLDQVENSEVIKNLDVYLKGIKKNRAYYRDICTESAGRTCWDKQFKRMVEQL